MTRQSGPFTIRTTGRFAGICQMADVRSSHRLGPPGCRVARVGVAVMGFRVKMVSEGDLPTGVGWAAVRDGKDRWLFVDGLTYSGGIPPAAITAVMRLRQSSSSKTPAPASA